MIPLFALAVIALHLWVWSHLTEVVRSGSLTKVKAALRYALWAALPLAAFVCIMAGAVALETGLGVTLISEGLARSSPLAAAILLVQAILGSLAFSFWCAFIPIPKNPGREPS